MRALRPAFSALVVTFASTFTLLLPAALLAASAPPVAPALSPAPVPAREAAMFRGNLAHTGAYDGPGPRTIPAVKWTFHTGGRIISSPAVADGLVFFGSGDGYVYALQAASGQVKWKFRTGDVVHASPAIADGMLYIGSWDSYFYALDAATGAERWRFKTGDDPEIHNQVGIQSSAAVVNGVVYFGCRDSHLYALDARTGAKKWAYGADGAWINTSPAVRNGKVYLATADEPAFLELDASTGARLFAQEFSWYFFASPAIVSDMAYAANWDGRLFGIDLKAHKVAWVFQTEASRQNLAKYTKPDGSMNFRAARSEPGAFYDDLVVALDRIFTMGSFLSSPVVADGVLYLGSADGNLYALK